MTRPLDALFDLADSAFVQVAPSDQLSPERRRTLRNLAVLERGRHPLKHGRLHPDAPPVDDRKAPGPRCGNCAHIGAQGGVAGNYPKCMLGPITGGPGTDVRHWWPGCSTWEAAP